MARARTETEAVQPASEPDSNGGALGREVVRAALDCSGTMIRAAKALRLAQPPRDDDGEAPVGLRISRRSPRRAVRTS
jgi:hypothetical protein